ncbi:MAG: glycosyltransferase family 2 protein [bacterium]
MEASIVIPAYNNKSFLEKNIPILINSIHNIEYEIVIIENGNADNSREFILNNYPQIKFMPQEKDDGFGASCNRGAALSSGKYILFLNTDVTVTDDFLMPLLEHIKDNAVFAVSPRIVLNNGEDEAPTSATFKGGSINIITRSKNIKTKEILFACGAAALVSRDKFNQIGGFDLLYRPLYFEDLDLSYQAWKRGWKTIYEPKSKVFHIKEGTTGKIRRSKIIRWNIKNKYLFIWKNITSKKMIVSHFFELILPKLLIPNINQWFGFGLALKQLKEALQKRSKSNINRVLSDKYILERTKDV